MQAAGQLCVVKTEHCLHLQDAGSACMVQPLSCMVQPLLCTHCHCCAPVSQAAVALLHSHAICGAARSRAQLEGHLRRARPLAAATGPNRSRCHAAGESKGKRKRKGSSRARASQGVGSSTGMPGIWARSPAGFRLALSSTYATAAPEATKLAASVGGRGLT